MDDRINSTEIILKWLIFWGSVLIGSILLACVMLIPLEYEREKLILEYNLVSRQLHLLQEANKIIKSQTQALGKDPQFTENIIRKELNLRKSGIETIKVNPVPIKIRKNASKETSELYSHLYILNNAESWYVRPFLEFKTRMWIFGLSIGLILVGIITAGVSET